MGRLLAVEALTDGLTSNGFDAERVSVADQQVRRRAPVRGDSGSGKVRFYTFVVVFSVQGLEPDRAEELTDAAQRYANKHKGGLLPRGFQNGTLTIPVFLCDRSSDATERWFGRSRSAPLCRDPIPSPSGPPQRRVGVLHRPVVTRLGLPRLHPWVRHRHHRSGAWSVCAR